MRRLTKKSKGRSTLTQPSLKQFTRRLARPSDTRYTFEKQTRFSPVLTTITSSQHLPPGSDFPSEAGGNRLVLNEAIHDAIFEELIPSAESFIWIATADIKDLHLAYGSRRKYETFLRLFDDLIESGIEIRLIHAKEPGPRFRADFDRFPNLVKSDRFERMLCPRNHMKAVIVDGRSAFLGSANLTGAGMGAKSASRRNFECGIISHEPELVTGLMDAFDELFMGAHCGRCDRRDICPDPVA
ncbi:MAG: phospholipase D-like domain-containing protein [Verrucomicrobiota bacterium]